MKSSKVLKMLSALAQENRLSVFRLLIQEGPEGLPAGTIADVLQIQPATLSFHLSQLSNAGLIKSEKDGRVVRYAAKYKSVKKMTSYLTENSFKKRQKEVMRESLDDLEAEEE